MSQSIGRCQNFGIDHYIKIITFFVTFKFDEMDDNLRKPRERVEFGHLSQILLFTSFGSGRQL